MNFDEWWTTYGLPSFRGYTDGELVSVCEVVHKGYDAGWEASKAEERERCLKIVEEYNGIKESPLHSTVSLIAEQIRKGD